MRILIIPLLMVLFFPMVGMVKAADQSGYDRVVAPFFAAHCNECHLGDKPKGEFSTEANKLTIDFSSSFTRSKWKEIVNVINNHEMPPKKEKQPEPKVIEHVLNWISEQVV